MEEADVVLSVGGERFNCHRSVLKKASPYFEAMFGSDMKEKWAEEIVIRDAEPDVFRILIDFAYERKVEVNVDNVVSLTETSNLFQFEVIQRKCCDFLADNLDVQNCVSVLILADFLNLDSLPRHVRSFIEREFSGIDKENDLSRLPLPLLSQLLSSDHLNCVDEMEVFRTIAAWIERNGRDHSVLLLSKLRFASLSEEETAEIRNHRLVKENADARNFLRLVEEARRSDFPNRSPADDVRGLGRSALLAAEAPPRRNVLPLVVGRWIPESEEAEEEDNPADGRWERRRRRETEGAPRLLIWTGNEFREFGRPFDDRRRKSGKHFYDGNAPVYGYVACVVENDLYCFGGERIIGSGHWNRTVWKCDLRDRNWREAGKMENPRRHCQAVVWDKRVYFIGGYGKFRKRLTTVECYDTRTGTWQNGADVPAPVHSSAVVAFNDVVYLFSTPIYRYVPAKDEWEEAFSWNETGFSAAFVFGNDLYAVTRRDRAVLLRFTLPRFEVRREFVFPCRIDCGCVCRNFFYGFDENLVVVYDLLKGTCGTKRTDGELRSEMCCFVPNFDS